MTVRDFERFQNQPHRRARGSVAEEAAVAWLRDRGFRIIDTNVVTKAGEIDILARDGEMLCFIEVKARATADFGPAVAAVDARKQQRLVRAAGLYLAKSGWQGACRFDVLGLDPGENGWEVTHLPNAFGA